MFRRPGTLVRRETLELARLVEKIGDGEEEGETITKIVTGGRGTGKTVYLLQAITMAFLKSWVVITVPEGNLHSTIGARRRLECTDICTIL